MNYQEMTDFELELLVAKHFLGEGSYSYDAEKSEVYLAGMDGGDFLPNAYFRPINSWADAGPIAEENEIGVVKVLNGWCATNDHVKHEGVFFVDPSPRRAICIVFLMMKGGE
ncbi:phage protein NinX family protein [Rosenbergiella epipactidis]|uniref:phage protein NinX family protein n=1 Tax=Rosenbergiella epipactidis TaxID=1544694 RepID=UPI001F4FB8A3|nr:phage protein NinX family protein [Rosenbergiella epipactidis]